MNDPARDLAALQDELARLDDVPVAERAAVLDRAGAVLVAELATLDEV